MSENIEITLPKLGESITEATVVQWFKKEGEVVELDEPLLEVSTDKINSEIPSPIQGKVKKIIAKENETIQVGAVLALVESSSASACEDTPKPKENNPKVSSENMKGFYSPAVMRLLQQKGISLEEAANIPATGEGGRLTKQDVERYDGSVKTPANSECTSDTERLKMTPLRKAIAENMVKSFYQAPHASIVSEVDVTDLMRLIRKEKEAFLQKHGCKLTITSFVAKAMAKAVHFFPLINSSLDNDTIVMKRFVNLGIAVSVDHGVMVPVIKRAEGMNIQELSKALSSLATKAREESLSPDDVKDGSITLTNFGMAGALIGTPIIRHPEVAILGMGAIHKKVGVLEDNTFGIREVMHLSLTFDHRVLDGMYGCGFLAEVKHQLETAVEAL